MQRELEVEIVPGLVVDLVGTIGRFVVGPGLSSQLESQSSHSPGIQSLAIKLAGSISIIRKLAVVFIPVKVHKFLCYMVWKT